MSYNMTILSSNADGSLGTYFCLTNNLASSLPVYIILIIIGLSIITVLLKKGYTLYTVMLPASFAVATLSTIFMGFTCSTGRMINPVLVMSFWLLVALFALMRKLVKE